MRKVNWPKVISALIVLAGMFGTMYFIIFMLMRIL
mgnify:CR=1 FL=1